MILHYKINYMFILQSNFKMKKKRELLLSIVSLSESIIDDKNTTQNKTKLVCY
jgi:hypothetical protein